MQDCLYLQGRLEDLRRERNKVKDEDVWEEFLSLYASRLRGEVHAERNGRRRIGPMEKEDGPEVDPLKAVDQLCTWLGELCRGCEHPNLPTFPYCRSQREAAGGRDQRCEGGPAGQVVLRAIGGGARGGRSLALSVVNICVRLHSN